MAGDDLPFTASSEKSWVSAYLVPLALSTARSLHPFIIGSLSGLACGCVGWSEPAGERGNWSQLV